MMVTVMVMILRWMCRMRRKMMMWRRVMLRRKACAGETHMDISNETNAGPCVETRMDFQKSHFARLLTGKMPLTNSGDGILCEPAQSKRTWTLHKSHFAQ